MGCAQSSGKLTDEDRQSQAVDRFLNDEGLKSLLNFKVLLLGIVVVSHDVHLFTGAGESGKSTVVKQLKVLHKLDSDSQEIQNYKITLHNNTITSMHVFVEAAEKYGYQFTPEEQELAQLVTKYAQDTDTKLMPPDVGAAVYKLAQSEAIKKTFTKRSEFWNLDASDYYFEHANRFSEEGFVPNEEDCIMARVRTTGIVATEFDEGPVHFSVVDVAGQRSERKKWIHCFDDVKALIFVVSLPGYNQVLFEDASHNRMQEALNLFQQICNNPLFVTTPIFLFLNKKDLFEKMIAETPLSKCFSDYSGPNEIKESLDFIQKEFEKRMEDENKKRLHTYIVAARFKKDIKYAWEEVKNVLLEENKKDVEEARKRAKKR